MGCPSKEEDIKIKKRPRVSTDCFTDCFINIYMFINQVSTVTFDNYNTNGTEKGWREFVEARRGILTVSNWKSYSLIHTEQLFVRISKLEIPLN